MADPFDGLRAILARHRPAPGSGDLPRFWGGAVGYVSYDAVRRFEPTVGARELPDSYDFSFAIGGTLIIFDIAAPDPARRGIDLRERG